MFEGTDHIDLAVDGKCLGAWSRAGPLVDDHDRRNNVTASREDLFDADEAFFTSTTKELMPIVQVDDRTIGTGAPGPVTRKLLAEYRRRANEMTAAAVR